ncbi:MAG: DNA polymerase III subunit gamma/tau [Gammaproteobacteria bacterium]|nr:DNA polymerase III subunit gamma/tau [Gammaproteobacteria bacterium]
MSYQVLARKWRPRIFSEVVGQEHVLRALINALDNNRLHHAYLFTGTRGVGKTTLGRILAKSLNCDKGVSASPCGVCSACQEIDQGRFVDLLEVDAASRTKVEDTRELLENVQYAPTRGRYKVYLIDEVHMLSNHSFNALLKTLEEPPPHVKFILATTDPQKLPVTILSRCLKFNLKVIPLAQIVGHLSNVLGQEGVEFDSAAIRLVARAAAGSMRDALSLTDQAISHGAGAVREAEVRAMLGTMDRNDVSGLLQALVTKDGRALLARVDELAQMGSDFMAVLEELLSVLHAVALKQVVPEHPLEEAGNEILAQQLSPADVQLYYQIALTGRRDLPLALDARAGFEMTLIRMLAFDPEMFAATSAKAPSSGKHAPAVMPAAEPVSAPAVRATEVAAEPAPLPTTPAAAPQATAARGEKSDLPSPLAAARAALAKNNSGKSAPRAMPAASAQRVAQPARPAPMAAPVDEEPPPYVSDVPPMMDALEPPMMDEPPPWGEAMHATAPVNTPPVTPSVTSAEPAWSQVVAALQVGGVIRQLALNSTLVRRDGALLTLGIAPSHEQLASKDKLERLQDALSEYYQQPMRVEIVLQSGSGETPAMQAQRERQERLAQAATAIENDPAVQAMKQAFGAQLDRTSIQLPEDKH